MNYDAYWQRGSVARSQDGGAAIVEACLAGVEQTFDLMGQVFVSAGSGPQALVQLTDSTEFSPLMLQFAALLLAYVPQTAADLGGLLARRELWRNQMLTFL